MSSWRIAPVLIVADVQASIAYYRDALGFEVPGSFGDPIEMAFVERGGVQLMLQDVEGKPTPGPNNGYKSVAWDALIWVSDVASLEREFEQSGAKLRGPMHETFYGHMEIEALDPDEHVICFSQPK